MIQRHLFRLSSAILLTGLLTCAQAVELGESLVRSHIGQPLSADIELTGIANAATSVQVALADPDVYRVANIAMHPALAALNITIVRRDKRRYLHIASPQAVESEHVNIFFELTENGRPSVRQATLWFTPDPNPAPPPVKAAPAAAPAAPPVVAPAAAPAKPAAVAAEPRRVLAAAIAAPVLGATPAAPAACVQKFTAAQIGTCAALDARNAALAAQIVELEEKVRLLTIAVHGKVGAPPPTHPAPPAPRAAPVKMVPMNAAAPARKSAGATPWLFIGIAGALGLALAGALVYVLRRKRKPGFIASVKNRLLPAKKEPWPPPEAEPAA